MAKFKVGDIIRDTDDKDKKYKIEEILWFTGFEAQYYHARRLDWDRLYVIPVEKEDGFEKVDDETEAKQNIVYLCDRKQCKNCSDTCRHTSDINHAVNFEHLTYDGQHWEKEIPERTETEDCGMILKPLFRLGDYVKCKYNENAVYSIDEIIYDEDGFSYGISEDQYYGMEMVRECDLELQLRPEWPMPKEHPNPKFKIGDKVILDHAPNIGVVNGLDVECENGNIHYTYYIVDQSDGFELPFPYNEEDLIIYSEDNIRRIYTERIEKYNEEQLAYMNKLLEENK